MRRFLIAVVLVAACSALAPSAAAAAPRWQTIPGDGHGFRGAWAVDRAWLFKDDLGAGADEMVIRSARIGAGRLGTWVTHSLANATTLRPPHPTLSPETGARGSVRLPL